MATALPAATVKSIPSRIDSVPPASDTCLPSPATSIETLLSMRLFFRLFAAAAMAAALAVPAAQAQTANDAPGSAARALLGVRHSLSAEYGLARGTGWVALLAARIDRKRVG